MKSRHSKYMGLAAKGAAAVEIERWRGHSKSECHRRKGHDSSVLITALITSAATAKRIQSTMKLGTAYLDVDFAVPPKVNMKFVSVKANEKDEAPRDLDDLEVMCK